ncbi:ependymin-related protein 2-like [Mytilus edulis]|uniref:Uncharacterized protein n=1 Tax=Mytilus edulis TaxID=6550 RepID=A0A8S3RLM8_MYTED|nr:unnamed protein product [Mytilus edulis]
MTSLLSILGLIALVPLVASNCCLPSQWEGAEGFHVGTVMNGTVRVSQGFMNISADTTGEKIALNMTVTTGIVGARKHTSEMFVLQDYGRKMQYVVEKGVCTKSAMQDPFTFNCVPSNATVVMKTTVGSDHTPGTIFKIPFGSIGDGYLTITDSGCIPVLYQVTANINGMQTMESVGIYDVKQGIKDMSVFTVPDICRTPGTVINVNRPQIKVGF